MSQAEREKWNSRYAAGAYANRPHPTRLLEEWVANVTPGRALDVACGAGRNALFLAKRGFAVDAVDISSVALERASSGTAETSSQINWIEADLDFPDDALPAGPYRLIVLIRYVDMSLYAHLIERLAPGGLLISEQHLISDQDVIGPKSPSYRLTPGQLRAVIGSLRLCHYFEGAVTDPDGRRAALAQVVAQR